MRGVVRGGGGGGAGGARDGQNNETQEQLPSYLDCFSNFCQQTILHGWHYLTDKGLNVFKIIN